MNIINREPWDKPITTHMKNEQLWWSIFRIMITIGAIIIISAILYKKDPYICLLCNLLVILIFDPLDSLPMQGTYGRSWVKSDEYKVQDKVNDIVLYTIVLGMHLIFISKWTWFEYLLIFLYAYRFIGVALAITTHNEIWLVVCPNLLGMVIPFYLLLKYVLGTSTPWIVFWMILSTIGMYIYEYIHHQVFVKN